MGSMLYNIKFAHLDAKGRGASTSKNNNVFGV